MTTTAAAIRLALTTGAIATLAVSGCTSSSDPALDGATSTAPSTRRTGQADSAKSLDNRIAAYVDAVNRRELGALVAAFDGDGAVLDVTRRIVGRDAIRSWAANEVIGGRLVVLNIEPRANGARLLVHWAPTGSSGWRASYDFTLTRTGIALADLQYAD